MSDFYVGQRVLVEGRHIVSVVYREGVVKEIAGAKVRVKLGWWETVWADAQWVTALGKEAGDAE